MRRTTSSACSPTGSRTGTAHKAGNRDDQDWHYYLYLIVFNEYLVAILAVIGGIRIFRNPTFAGKFIVWTALATLISYSWADERFPWLVLHPMVPMCILAGYGVVSLWGMRHKRYLPLVALLMTALLATTLYRSFTMNYVDQRSPMETVTQLEQTEEYEAAVDKITKIIDYSVESGQGPLYLSIDTYERQPALWYFRDYISSFYPGFSSEYAGFLEITDLADDNCPCDFILWVDTDLAVDHDSGEIYERYPSRIIEDLFPQHRIERAPVSGSVATAGDLLQHRLDQRLGGLDGHPRAVGRLPAGCAELRAGHEPAGGGHRGRDDRRRRAVIIGRRGEWPRRGQRPVTSRPSSAKLNDCPGRGTREEHACLSP